MGLNTCNTTKRIFMSLTFCPTQKWPKHLSTTDNCRVGRNGKRVVRIESPCVWWDRTNRCFCINDLQRVFQTCPAVLNDLDNCSCECMHVLTRLAAFNFFVCLLFFSLFMSFGLCSFLLLFYMDHFVWIKRTDWWIDRFITFKKSASAFAEYFRTRSGDWFGSGVNVWRQLVSRLRSRRKLNIGLFSI